MPVSLLLFDCDGTLVDTEEIHAGACIAAYRACGVSDAYLQDFQARFTGFTLRHIHPHICADTGLTCDVATINALVKEKTAQRLQDTPIPAAPYLTEALEALAHLPRAVVSNGHRGTVLHSLQAAGLSHWFAAEQVFTKCQVANPKPAPDLYLLAAAEAGIPPPQCLVIEDSTAGIRAGLAAGMLVLGYTGLSVLPDAPALLTAAGAPQVFDDYRLLPSLVAVYEP
jgi:HAD superfamily hydrolase (TIGR01509 family)